MTVRIVEMGTSKETAKRLNELVGEKIFRACPECDHIMYRGPAWFSFIIYMDSKWFKCRRCGHKEKMVG